MPQPLTFKPGDFVFYRTEALSGWVIRRLQKKLVEDTWISEVNHVAYCVEEPDWVLEDVIPKSVVRRSSSVPKRKVVAVVRPKFFDELGPNFRVGVVKVLSEKAKGMTGKTYSVWQIFGMFIWSVAGLLGWKLERNPIRGGAFCTERAIHLKMDGERYAGKSDPMNTFLTEDDTAFPAYLLRVFLNSYKMYEVTKVE